MSAVGKYATESDLDDLRGADNITEWSDLTDAGTRDTARIQRAFDQTDAQIHAMLRHLYAVPLAVSLMADMNRSAPEMRAFESWMTQFVIDLSDGKLDGRNADPGVPIEIEGSAGIPYNNVNSFAPLEYYESPDSPKYLGFTDAIAAYANNVDPFPVPEPGTLAVIVTVIAAMLLSRRRRVTE